MIDIKAVASGKEYRLDTLAPGHLQYMDRLYEFSYVPEQLRGCTHIRTCGDDKMIGEEDWCFTVETDRAYDVYVLYPDKQPVLPRWLETYRRVRMTVTRVDSMAFNLKGYFSCYHRRFEPGEIRFYGNSPSAMLAEEWYVASRGNTYCMYSVAMKEV